MVCCGGGVGSNGQGGSAWRWLRAVPSIAGAGETGPGARPEHTACWRRAGALRIAEGLEGATPCTIFIARLWPPGGRPEIDPVRPLPAPGAPGRREWNADHRRGSRRWSSAAEDIRALRRMAADGPLACEESSRALVAASLSAAMVVNDDQGNTRLKKKGTNNTARDDVAAALVLSAGAHMRSLSQPRPRWRYQRHGGVSRQRRAIQVSRQLEGTTMGNPICATSVVDLSG